MARSLANGDYSLIMAIESASRPNSWYRVLADRLNGNFSCDCPAWTFRGGNRRNTSCKHTLIAQQLLATPQIGVPVARARGAAAETNILVQATRQQWPGLGGTWAIEQRNGFIDNTSYQFVVLRLTAGNGTSVTGMVAFTNGFHQTTESLIAGVAGWAGYAIAAELARRAGYPLAGQPPQHYIVTRRGTGRTSRIGLHDILRVGEQVDLGDGYTPTQRAENTLRLFLGEELYNRLEQQRFLDVSSVLYAGQQRVYRVRRDPQKRYERRVRVFEDGTYVNDFCIVRAQNVPEADHWLTVFLGLISDEANTLSVVQTYNIFSPHSDGYEPEITPAMWQARIA
jgi:hypothetical protein